MPKITGIQTESKIVTVDVSAIDLFYGLRNLFREISNIPSGYPYEGRIENGVWVTGASPADVHSSDGVTYPIRDATPEEITIWKGLQELEALLYSANYPATKNPLPHK